MDASVTGSESWITDWVAAGVDTALYIGFWYFAIVGLWAVFGPAT